MENQWFHYPSKRRSDGSERKKERRGKVDGHDFAWIHGDNVMLGGPNEKPGFRGSSNGTYYAGWAESIVALPVSIGSISLSSCQLFLCARQIVAAEYIQKRAGGAGAGMEWGVVGLN